MKKICSIIVDDEYHAREFLESLIIEYCPEINIVASCKNTREAEEAIYGQNPDVVFFDISFPEIDGFEFLKSLPYKNFSLVFVTAYSEFAIRAVKAKAVDYLLKPVCVNELQECVKRLLKINTSANTSAVNKTLTTSKCDTGSCNIILPRFNGFAVYKFNEIIRLEADRGYTKVFLSDKRVETISKTLGHFEKLKCKYFLRIHKSHIINLFHLKEFSYTDGGCAILKDGSQINISRRRLNGFFEKSRTVI